MMLLESYRYRLHVRRFIVELFDKSVVEQLVRGGRGGERRAGEMDVDEQIVGDNREADDGHEDLEAVVGLAS